MIKDGFGAGEGLQFSVNISRRSPAGSTDHLIFAIKNNDKPTGVIGEFTEDGIIRPAHSRVELLAGEDGAANHGAGYGDGLAILSVEGKASEAMILPRGDQERGLIDARAEINRDTVRCV